MSYVEIKNINSWREYVEIHEKIDLSPYIFRGQSNAIDAKGEFIKWKLESSFNRFYTKKNSFNFSSVLSQQLQDQLFNSFYSKYLYNNITNLTAFNALQKCIYLQHYGIPTCLIDFTFDPMIAMYFAMSGIQGSSGSTYQDGNSIHFSTEIERDYVSIYRINTKILESAFSIKEINTESFDSYLLSYETHYHRDTALNAKLGLVLKPEEDRNFNLSAQKGCFLLFDNHNAKDIDIDGKLNVDFIRFLENHQKYYNLNIAEPVMTIFNIRYNSFMRGQNRIMKNGVLDPNYISAFEFLRRKKFIGKNLFDDIQGLKYDFNFMHDVDR